MAWWKMLAALTAVLLLLFGVLHVAGAMRWRSLTAALNAQLDAARQPPATARYDERELEGLPAPVQRYFRAALSDGAPIVAAATVDHAGSFNMGETTDQWRPFTSHQRVVTRSPGFVWDGAVSMLPGLPVRVHDAYVAGVGMLRPAILGLFTLVHLRDRGEVARGELMRFFAEAAWYPTALLPSQGVQWQAVDDHSARATLVDGPLVLTMTFRFNPNGLIDSVRAQARGRMVAGQVIPTPWEGRWSNYQQQGGMTVPMTGEVAWLLPQAQGGDKAYWRGTVTALHYEFAP